MNKWFQSETLFHSPLMWKCTVPSKCSYHTLNWKKIFIGSLQRNLCPFFCFLFCIMMIEHSSHGPSHMISSIVVTCETFTSWINWGKGKARLPFICHGGTVSLHSPHHYAIYSRKMQTDLNINRRKIISRKRFSLQIWKSFLKGYEYGCVYMYMCVYIYFSI